MSCTFIRKRSSFVRLLSAMHIDRVQLTAARTLHALSRLV